jgi:FKBP-type peptidyl-prolyl cis-trans isomerase FklB
LHAVAVFFVYRVADSMPQDRTTKMRIPLVLLGAALCCPVLAADTPAAESVPGKAVHPMAVPTGGQIITASELKTPKDQVSYATGVTTVRNMQKQGIAFDLDLVIRGMRDSLTTDKLAMSEKEIRQAMSSLMADVRRNQAANQRALGEKNLRRGNEFRDQFSKQDGVVKLPNGVLYRVIKQGQGPKPGELDTVMVKYRGATVLNQEFDATEGDRPVPLRMAQTIVGWREALKQMPVGSRWEVVIPPNLAYGDRGVGDMIGPHETLVFDVELVDIKPAMVGR